jgi:hypothetical protein
MPGGLNECDSTGIAWEFECASIHDSSSIRETESGRTGMHIGA